VIIGAQYGTSIFELFRARTEPNRRPGGPLFAYVLRCRACDVAASKYDPDPTHGEGCPVGAFIARWRQEGNTQDVVDAFDVLLRQLNRADEWPLTEV
jgi:hypothetical protein